MDKVLLYGYCIGLRVLAANQTPDFRTLSDFRQRHLAALADLFLQVLALSQRVRLVQLGHVALNAIKVKAKVAPQTVSRDLARWSGPGQGKCFQNAWSRL